MYTNQSQSPEHLPSVLIQAAQQHTKTTELLQEFSDQHPENAAEIKLTMAQSKISQGNISKSIGELKQKPGMVSAFVIMYSHEEDIDSAIEVFTQTIQWCQNHRPKSPAHLSLIRETANFKYRQKKEAISDLEQQWKQNPKDFHTLTQLISASSLVDPEKDKALCEHLSLSDSMTLKVDVNALETSPGAMYIWKKSGKVTRDSQRKEQGW
uniref:Uncharacterized protein n=1 Tax=Nomascus leucogenys TaxID=61853 RepID=A0A2I3GKT3_NOMLE